jgi:hypothetical protein
MLVARVKWVYRTVLSIAVVSRDRLYPTSLQTAFMSFTLTNLHYHIMSNFSTPQQSPPWLSGKASHLYQLDMRRSLVPKAGVQSQSPVQSESAMHLLFTPQSTVGQL